MPYLQLDLEAKKRVPKVARALGVPDMQIGWGLIELWDWCWNEKRDTVSLLMLDGFFGAIPHAGEMLAEFGFLERVDAGWRVRGASRYLRIVGQKTAAGKVRAAEAKRDSCGRLLPADASGHPAPSQHPASEGVQQATSGQPALTPNTEHRTPNKEKPPNPLSGEPVRFEKEVQEVEDYYVEALGAQGKHPKRTARGRGHIRARLAEGSSVAELKAAIDGLTWSEHHMKGGFTGIKYALRSQEQMQMILERLPPEERDHGLQEAG